MSPERVALPSIAAVEGLAKKGFVRDRDYKILYGVGNSPPRAQALEAGKIQASPFSFLGKTRIGEKRVSGHVSISAKAISGISFRRDRVGKTKVDNDPEGIVALLRAMNRGLELSQKEPKKKSRKWSSRRTPSVIRQRCGESINQFADVYSTSISRKDIDALIARRESKPKPKKLGGPEKFFTQQFLTKALSQSR